MKLEKQEKDEERAGRVSIARRVPGGQAGRLAGVAWRVLCKQLIVSQLIKS